MQLNIENINPNLYIRKEYKKNQILFNESDNVTNIYLIISGEVKIVTNTYLSNEYEINLISNNEFIGTNIIFKENPKYLGTGIVYKKSNILVFTKENFIKALTNRNFLEFFLEYQSNNALKIQRKVKILSQKSLKEKILFLLHENYKITNSYTFKFTNKKKLSDYLNCERPSLSRMLIQLKKENLIDYDLKSITLKKIGN